MIILLSTVMCSNEIYRRRQREVIATNRMANAVDEIISLISYGNYDVYTICSRIYECMGIVNDAVFSAYGDFKEQWSSAINNIQESESKTIFNEVGDIIGAYDSNTQISKLTYIRDVLRKNYDSQNVILSKNRRIYYTMGCFLGLMLVIIVI